MPITITEGTRVLQAYGVQAKKKATLTRQSILGEVALSQRGKEIRKALEAISKLPETREDRIAAIRKKLANGEGIVASDSIAEKMIFQGIADRLR